MVTNYRTFLRSEPRARGYVIASLVDDVGVAASAWASALLMTNLATTQQARASLMLPALLCFLIGTLVAGPIADWRAGAAPIDLARYRWKVVLIGRAIETALLGLLVVLLASGPPTIATVLPYVMTSAFMKTALRATRIAFSVDLLGVEHVAHDAQGKALSDERGQPLLRKTHLMSFSTLVSAISTLALLIGLLLGDVVMERVEGRSYLLFAFDVLTNIGFIALLYLLCRPTEADGGGAAVAPEGPRLTGLRHVWDAFSGGFRFLRQPAQRPLVALLGGAFLVEIITESYDGKMVIKHILEGSDEQLRHAEITWTVVSIVGALLLPSLLRRGPALGKVFLGTMLLDGLVIALAGTVAARGGAASVLPFVGVVALDKSLTLTSTTITELAQNSVSSSAMRGRIAGAYAIVVIVGDMLVEGLAAAGEESWGIPGVIQRAGLFQVVAMLGLVLLGGRGLLAFRLDERSSGPADAEA